MSAVQLPRASDHVLGDVDADALFEAVRECARHTAETAAEVEGPQTLLGMPELGGAIHQRVGLGGPVAKNSSLFQRPKRLPGAVRIAQ